MSDNVIMKKALKLVQSYFSIFIISVLIGTFLYSLYMDVTGFIYGQRLNFFDVDEIFKALFIVSYCVCFLISPFLCYYRIRHTFGVPQTIAFIILMIITWAGIFPGLSFLERKVYEVHPFGNQISHLSGGYFRRAGDKIYYFNRDLYSNPFSDGHTKSVIIDTSDDGIVTFEELPDNPDLDLYTEAKPYNEIQAKESFSNRNFDIGIDFRFLVDKALECFGMGWTYYLGFVSIGLLLASLYALTSLFSWRLLNTSTVFGITILVLSINTFLYSPEASKIVNKLEEVGFIFYMKNIFENPSVVLFNLIFSLIFIALGITRFIIKNCKKAEE